MKVIGFCPIFYGKEYLKESLQSIKEHCEKVVVAYTPRPSHGFGTTDTCPDTREEIYNIANEVLGDKLIWNEDVYGAENQHRKQIYSFSMGYDLILSIDADEVFESSELQNALNYAYTNTQRHYGMKGYLNFWRCFDFVCTDGFRPIRIENLAANNNDQNLECPLTIYHFSTAQSEPIMRYKYKIFGHASEIKEDWLNKTHYGWDRANEFGNLHCVANDIWNAVPFDKTTMPESLKQHPNYNKDLI